MSEFSDKIGNRQLNQVIIPGSHDSATYKLEPSIGKNQNITSKFNLLKYVGLGDMFMKIAQDWSQTQDRTVYRQLSDGIRYLDLRVIYRDSKKDFYTVHGLYGPALSDVLEQITSFLKEHPKEIVIIQIGDMRYMGANQEQAHEELIAKFEKAFHDKMIKRNEFSGPTMTIDELWKNKKQVFLIHDKSEAVKTHNTVWSKNYIISPWANTDKITELKKKLDKSLADRPFLSKDRLYVIQAQMTGNPRVMLSSQNPLSKGYKSLRGMADAVRATVPDWLKDWKDIKPNIIMLDFVEPTITRKIYELNAR